MVVVWLGVGVKNNSLHLIVTVATTKAGNWPNILLKITSGFVLTSVSKLVPPTDTKFTIYMCVTNVDM